MTQEGDIQELIEKNCLRGFWKIKLNNDGFIIVDKTILPFMQLIIFIFKMAIFHWMIINLTVVNVD
jgi:hypothetical protein